MVTISSYSLATNQEQEEFVVLELQGDVTLVQSQTIGNFYATAMKANITSTFSEEVAKTMLGKQLPGQIIKQPCEPYDYTIPDSDEVITYHILMNIILKKNLNPLRQKILWKN